MWGYVDKSGQMVIKPQFEVVTSEQGNCDSFSEGLACFIVNDRVGYIDKTGKIIIQPQYLAGSPFRSGVAAVGVGEISTTHKSGYIDKTGRYIWQPSK